MLTRLRLGFSHLRQHKFRHGFKDTLNPFCSCSIEAETTTHYFLRCHFYNSNQATLINDLENIPISFFTVSDNNLINLLLYGNDKFETQRIEQYYCQISDSLKIHRGLMSNFSDNLPACYAYIFRFVCYLIVHI